MSANANLRDSKLSSSKVYHKYAIHRSQAIYMKDNLFQIPDSIRDIFPTYYLLRWQARYFMREVEDGTIAKHGITYQIIYYNTNPTEVLQLVKKDADLYLSFRELVSDYETMPTVLVGLTPSGVRPNE